MVLVLTVHVIFAKKIFALILLSTIRVVKQVVQVKLVLVYGLLTAVKEIIVVMLLVLVHLYRLAVVVEIWRKTGL